MAYDSAKTKPAEVKTPNTPFEALSTSVEAPDYTDEESKYRHHLLLTMTTDFNRREQTHPEFNGMTYSQNYKSNMLGANSFTPPRKNAEDTQVVTGTTREKVLAIVSAVLQLNFETKFSAFDKDDIQDEEIAEAMTDCVERANMIEQWDEKKIYAYFEMATQGDVYVQELYVDETVTEKKKYKLSEVTEALMKDFKSDNTKKMTVGMCQRNIIPGTQVYKGSMTERIFRNQPHIFTREVKPYEYTKSIFGKLPRFKNVPRHLVTEGPGVDLVYGINWRLESTDSEMCEIIQYQDRFNDEYQIIINGVMMLPVGFPMPWESGEYNIVQGSLEPISAFFSESKSIPAKTKLDQEILDEMYRLAVLKTQKSFMPPIANYSVNLLRRDMFLPGKVNNSLQKGDIEVLGGDPSSYSMKPSEFQMIEMIKKFIDEKSVDPLMQGQNPGGDQTATQINTVTQQAKQKLGLMIFGFIQFHMNLDTLRLYNILENYTKPIDTQLDKATDGIVNKYRTITVQKSIGEKGMGTKKIQFTTKHNKPSELWDMENGVKRDENGTPIANNPPQRPTRILQVNPEVIRSIKYSWYGQCDPTQRETPLTEQIAFEDSIMKAMQIFGQQSVNQPYAQKEWAVKKKIDPDLFFNKNQQPPQPPADPNNPQGPLPQPQESNMTKQMRPYSSGAGPAEAMRQGK